MDGMGQQLEKHTFDLSRAVLSVTLPFESMAFETGKTMVPDVTPNLQYNGNGEMLKQMAVILNDNALKYANDGGAVTVSLLTRGDRRILRVHNTGVGIKQEDLPRIFERFYRPTAGRRRATDWVLRQRKDHCYRPQGEDCANRDIKPALPWRCDRADRRVPGKKRKNPLKF